ncbi:hypothetical protein DFH08DRAFT_817051 [Mycena albidolilacea]|uniref:Uncharacterized protein n=1 Tax=Mycena albidolilacea TaxID=1033008 RepID=A0AAD7EHP6_9AGAR|nr:hypothetical protein DFH08DRAFT_817051 [Mycena albidolilacea]
MDPISNALNASTVDPRISDPKLKFSRVFISAFTDPVMAYVRLVTEQLRNSESNTFGYCVPLPFESIVVPPSYNPANVRDFSRYRMNCNGCIMPRPEIKQFNCISRSRDLHTNKFIQLLPGIMVNTFNLCIVTALVATTVNAIPVVERDSGVEEMVIAARGGGHPKDKRGGGTPRKNAGWPSEGKARPPPEADPNSSSASPQADAPCKVLKPTAESTAAATKASPAVATATKAPAVTAAWQAPSSAVLAAISKVSAAADAASSASVTASNSASAAAARNTVDASGLTPGEQG